MLQFIYTIYIALFAIPVFIVITVLTAIVTIIGCALGGEKVFSFYPGMIWSRLTCLLAFCPVKVIGRENIQKGQSYVFVANHQGAFDIFLIYGYLGMPIKWMMKVGLAKIPFIGSACRAAGFVFVDNSSLHAARQSIIDAEHQLRKGASLAVFPEGSRTNSGKMRRFHKGAFQVALDQRLPIIPITLNGPYKILSIDSKMIRPNQMEMVIHPPISIEEVSNLAKDGLQPLADHARTTIESALWEEFK